MRHSIYVSVYKIRSKLAKAHTKLSDQVLGNMCLKSNDVMISYYDVVSDKSLCTETVTFSLRRPPDDLLNL